MKETKLIINLSALSTKALGNFRDFVHSPFFNKHKETTLFFDFLYDHNGRWERLTKEHVFAAIFPGEKYKEHSINNLMFNLMELLKQFIGQLVYAKKNERALHVIEGAQEQNLRKLSLELIEKEFKKQQKQPVKEGEHFKQLFHLYEFEDNIKNVHQQKIDESLIQHSLYNFEIWFIIEKLRLSCDLLNRMLVYNHQYDLGMIKHLLDYLKERWDYFGKILLVNMYYKILLIFLEPKKHEHFFTFVEVIEKYRDQCNTEDAKRLYDYAINLGIEFLNQEGRIFLSSVFKLYLLLIEDGLHIERGEVDQMRYKNIITLACKVGEFEWARNFMDTHYHNLNVVVRENAYNYNLAFLYYQQQKYQEALVLLSKLNYENVFFQINAKVMQIRIFYALGEYDVLLSFLDSFKLYLIRNKKVARDRINMNINNLRFTRKFVYLMISKETHTKSNFKEKLQKLYAETLQTEMPVIGKDWLLENISTALKG